MRLLFINKIGQNLFREWEILPRIGDCVDLFYRPFPIVSNVLLMPGTTLKNELGINPNEPLDAIITLD